MSHPGCYGVTHVFLATFAAISALILKNHQYYRSPAIVERVTTLLFNQNSLFATSESTAC